jgi:hypothetical protein
MIDLEQARAFVQAQGNEIEQLRLVALVDGVYPAAVPESLAALQNSDGGFPFGLTTGRPSALSPTAYVLSWLRDLRLATSDAAQRALQFIERQQTPRGIWRESADLQAFNPPPWMDSESVAADVYTTALCASTLALLSDNDLPVDQAVAWLQTQQGRDGLLSGFRAHSSWLALPAFVTIYGQETRATRRLVAGLGSILDEGWPASMLAWLLQSALDANYTRRTELVNRAWQLLGASQQPDGSFSLDEGDDPVHTTLQAIDVAQRLGR